jgi:hypothetical protein
LPRFTSTLPMRSSSSFTRCEIADGVTFSSRAARSNEPWRSTAASASSKA